MSCRRKGYHGFRVQRHALCPSRTYLLTLVLSTFNTSALSLPCQLMSQFLRNG